MNKDIPNPEVLGLEIRSMREEERRQFQLMTAQSFTLPRYREQIHASTPLDEAWVLVCDTSIQGALRAETIGQFFGGESVPCVAISAVQVLPQGRGRGYGKMLMMQVMSQMRDTGVALSVLYPTNVGFYRSLGYEIAGAYTQYSVPILSLPRYSSHAVVEPFGDEDIPLVHRCYRRYAEGTCGLLDRSERWWTTRVFGSTDDHPIYRYLIRNNGGVSGYLIYSQEPQRSGFEYSYSLICHDLVWSDSATAEALLAFAAGHVVVGVDVTWAGPIENPLAEFIQLQQPEIKSSSRWMARLLDVKKAVESRGYERSQSAVIELDVGDSVFPANSGPIRIEVSGGKAKVKRIDKARASMDVGALAAIFTGWLPARDAVRSGRLKNSSLAEVQILEALFASPKPWCFDRF